LSDVAKEAKTHWKDPVIPGISVLNRGWMKLALRLWQVERVTTLHSPKLKLAHTISGMPSYRHEEPVTTNSSRLNI